MATQFKLNHLATDGTPRYGVVHAAIPAITHVGESFKIAYTGHATGEFLDTSADTLLLGAIEEGVDVTVLDITPATDASATATTSVTVGGVEVLAAAAVANTILSCTVPSGTSGDIELLTGTVSTAAGLGSDYLVEISAERIS